MDARSADTEQQEPFATGSGALPFGSLVDELPVLISYVDAEGHYRFNNKTYELWFGRPRAAIYGRHVRDVVGHDAYAVIEPYLRRALAGERLTFDLTPAYRDAGTRLVRVTYVPDFDQAQRVRGVYAFVEDLTDLRRTQQELRRAHDDLEHRVVERTTELLETNQLLQREIAERMRAERALADSQKLISAVVETVPSLVVVADADGRILLFNEGCEKLTGYRRDEVIGKDLLDLLLPDEWKPVVLKRFTDSDAMALREPHENPWLTRSGEQRTIEWRCAKLPFADSDRPFVLGFGVDVTERRQAEQRARHQAAELARLMRVNTLGEMAAALAHELNQPLAAVLSYTQGVLRMMQSSSELTDEIIGYMEKAAQQARRAGDIIHHIRRFVRRDDPVRTPADINHLVAEAANFARAEAAMHQVAINLDLAPRLPLIAVERVAIEQVVVNLLHNSVEALLHKSAGTREVQIATAANGDGTIEVRVSDNGPGLPAEMVPQIFEPFATSKWNGIGLGLPMSRSIVREHGGELWLVSSTGLGAEFRFSLPVEGVTNRAGS